MKADTSSRSWKLITALILVILFGGPLVIGRASRNKSRDWKVFYLNPYKAYEVEPAPKKLYLIETKSEMPCGQSHIIVEYEYLGTYFVTAYSDEETWCRWTASGEEVHYSDEWYEPTSAAIDLNYHSFGEILLVGDPDDPDNRKIYITEDTGSAVKGHHIDCFVESLEEVYSFDTRYDSVWRVTYIDTSMTEEERELIYDSIDDYL